jgi:hypothetical protein
MATPSMTFIDQTGRHGQKPSTSTATSLSVEHNSNCDPPRSPDHHSTAVIEDGETIEMPSRPTLRASRSAKNPS